MFTNNKIFDFKNKIQKLADRPQMSAQALKEYFDGSAEELRIAHNALVDALSSFVPGTFADVRYDAETGKLTFVLSDGTEKEIDLPLELLIKSGHYDAQTKNIVLVLANGDTLNIPVGDLVDTYHADGSTLVCENNTFAVKESVFARAEQVQADIAETKAEAVAAAKAYTDTLADKTATDITNAKTVVLDDAKAYADTRKLEAIEHANDRADSVAGFLSEEILNATADAKAYTDERLAGINPDALPVITLAEADTIMEGVYRITDAHEERNSGILIADFQVSDSTGVQIDLCQTWIKADASIWKRSNTTEGYVIDDDYSVQYEGNSWQGWTQWEDVVQTKIEKNRKLKLLKTITLEEDVATVSVTFEKPLDEIAILNNIAFTKQETGRFATRSTDSVYLFFRSNLSLSTSKRYWYTHAKEISERQWVCLASEWFYYNNGLGDSTTQPRTAFSSRANMSSRYIKNIDIFIPNNTTENAFAAGSTIEIWGHEADE